MHSSLIFLISRWRWSAIKVPKKSLVCYSFTFIGAVMSITEEVQRAIEEAIPGAEVRVLDPMNDNTHLEAVVVSPKFEGVSLVARHQMVMQPLTKHFNTTLHALALKTYTPEQWKVKQET
jgi:stress-induced morphogen